MVPLVKVPKMEGQTHLSAMQLVKGLKKGESTFIATIASLDEYNCDKEALPPCIEKVLEENKDVMPEELLRHLPPRHKSEKKLTPKQARWKDFLAEFDYELEYKCNVVADALSKKFKLPSITTERCDIQDAIKDSLQHDPKARRLMQLAAQGKMRHFWIEYGLLLTTG
ncbi:uncharacterized protein LOC129903622 [Solanum dulcamara]|uniref:uncharacterized protein LOC129903622 n=1 Tax=Solanum dulcamara TaxID=45834 RepID=UPI002484FE9B|nr:uncharacterized protein LOC129903622 [Solanum dulcamara]